MRTEGHHNLTSRVLWVEMCLLPKKLVKVLTPGTSACDLVWKWSLYRDNQVKTKSLGWTLIQYDYCPYKETFKTETDMQRRTKMWRPWENARWRWMQRVELCFHKPEDTKDWWVPPKARKRQGRIVPFRLQGGITALLTPWFRHLASRTVIQ